jgi:hypothetical protein
MILLLLLALLPLTAEAQVTFGPLRLDDSLAHFFYYPDVSRQEDTTLRCMWSSQIGAVVKVQSHTLGLEGTPIGPRILVDSAGGQFTCPAFVSQMPLNSGGEARLVHHS